MTHPEQPGAWSDPSWSPTPGAWSPTPGGDVPPPQGYAPGYGYGVGYPAPAYEMAPPTGGYAVPVYPGGPPPSATTNSLAIASLVCSLAGLLTCGITALVGAVLGHVAKRQIRERHEGGESLATAGIITGWIIFTLFTLMIIGYGLVAASVLHGSPDMFTPTPAPR